MLEQEMGDFLQKEHSWVIGQESRDFLQEEYSLMLVQKLREENRWMLEQDWSNLTQVVLDFHSLVVKKMLEKI